MQWVYRAKQSTNKRKICLLQKPDLGKDVHMFSPGSTVSPSWTHLAWLSHLISPDWLSHLTPSLEFLSYLSFIHLDGNVLNLQVQTGFWTL